MRICATLASCQSFSLTPGNYSIANTGTLQPSLLSIDIGPSAKPIKFKPNVSPSLWSVKLICIITQSLSPTTLPYPTLRIEPRYRPKPNYLSLTLRCCSSGWAVPHTLFDSRVRTTSDPTRLRNTLNSRNPTSPGYPTTCSSHRPLSNGHTLLLQLLLT